MKIIYLDQGISPYTKNFINFLNRYSLKNTTISDELKFYNNLNFYLASFYNGNIIYDSYYKIKIDKNLYKLKEKKNTNLNQYLKISINLYHKRLPRPRYFHYIFPYLLKRLIKRFSPDLIHGNYLTTNGYYISKSSFHPTILQAMGSDILIQLKKWPYLNWIKKALIYSDIIFVNANIQKEIILKLKLKKEMNIKVFPLGIDLNVFKKKNNYYNSKMFNNFSYNYKRKYLLCNRKHEKIYGWELLLNALKIVIQKNPNIYLLSLGTGSETNHLKEIANRLDIFKNIYWLGDIPNDLVPLYLNLSDLYISPSISDGTSLSLQEAMACETPIIVYNIPANLEWIKNGENGIIFKKRNKRLLAKLILASIGDDQIRKNFGKKNRAIAEKNFSYKLYLSNIFKAYRELDK